MISVEKERIPIHFFHFTPTNGSKLIQLGRSSSSLRISIQSQISDIRNAIADPRWIATLQFSLSNFTVSHPMAPCHRISANVKEETPRTLGEFQISFLTRNQFTITKGPTSAPASNLWNHSVKIWKDVYLCPEPLESASSGFSSHHSPCSSSEMSKPKVPKHVGQSGHDSPASYILIIPPMAITMIVKTTRTSVALLGLTGRVR